MVKNIIKNTKKDSEKKHVKGIEIFLNKKEAKGEKRSEADTKIFLKNNFLFDCPRLLHFPLLKVN